MCIQLPIHISLKAHQLLQSWIIILGHLYGNGSHIQIIIFAVHSGDPYEAYAAGSGNGDDNMHFPITPPISDQDPQNGEEEVNPADGPPRKKVCYIIFAQKNLFNFYYISWCILV